MTREAIVANAKKKYANADEATIDAVLRTLQETKFDWRLPDQSLAADATAPEKVSIAKPLLKFIGEHLTLEEYRKLSLHERGELKRRLKEQNREWLEKKFAGVQTAWLMVLDGEVIASGESLGDYPSTEKIREIGLRHRKRPFVFINDWFVMIEESHSPYHPMVSHNIF